MSNLNNRLTQLERSQPCDTEPLAIERLIVSRAPDGSFVETVHSIWLEGEGGFRRGDVESEVAFRTRVAVEVSRQSEAVGANDA